MLSAFCATTILLVLEKPSEPGIVTRGDYRHATKGARAFAEQPLYFGTGRSVYCASRIGLLYSAEYPSPNFTILRVVETRIRILGSNLQPLHPRIGPRS